MNLAFALACFLLLQDPPASTPSADPASQSTPANPAPNAPASSVPQTPATEPAPQEPVVNPATDPATAGSTEPTATPAATPTATPTVTPVESSGTTPATPPATPPASEAPASGVPVTPPATASTTDAPSAPAAAGTQAASDVPPITEQDLSDVLELAGMNAVSSLEREVKSLQQTLDGLVLADDESVVKIHGAKGSEDDLEGFGVDDAVARQVRRLLDEVKSKRAKLALLDLRGASSNNPNDGLRSVTEVADSAAKDGGATTTAAPVEPKPVAQSPKDATAQDASEPTDVLAGPSPDPQREALIAFRDRDVATVLELLAETPPLRMKPMTLWVYGSCLMSERRYGDAKAVFTRLKDEKDHPQLAHGADLQLKRITFIENALVGEGPSTETKK